MPGLRYRGLAAKFRDRRFAWKFFGVNLFFMMMITLYMISSQNGSGPVRDPQVLCVENPIEWSEFLSHTCENENLWLVIDGKVYNMWPWGVEQHPGGRMICQGAGKDSSEIFHAIHPDYVREQFLKQFCVGFIVNQPPPTE